MIAANALVRVLAQGYKAACVTPCCEVRLTFPTKTQAAIAEQALRMTAGISLNFPGCRPGQLEVTNGSCILFLVEEPPQAPGKEPPA